MGRGARPVAALTAMTALGCLLVAGPARATTVDLDVSDAALALASAAAQGAGSAAAVAVVQAAERAAFAVGGAATTVKPSGTVAAKSSVAALPGRTWRWNGWVSGAAGTGTVDGSFGTWRGEPLGLVGAWADREATAQTEMSTLDAYANFDGEVDIAVGGLVAGETWEQAAAGLFVTRWTTAVRNIKAKRAGKGTTYIRIAHEFNGDWMVWGVTDAATAEAYKKGYRLYASIVRKEFPEARLAWSPNATHHSRVSIEDLYPGNDVVDVIAPDLYDFDTDPSTTGVWQKLAGSWLTPESPNGIEAWRQYAVRKGKPMALPEWGLAAGDDPEWIKQVHAFMAKHAAPTGSTNVAGKVVYDCYFNAEEKFKLFQGPNSAAGVAYASLTWGS